MEVEQVVRLLKSKTCNKKGNKANATCRVFYIEIRRRDTKLKMYKEEKKGWRRVLRLDEPEARVVPTPFKLVSELMAWSR